MRFSRSRTVWSRRRRRGRPRRFNRVVLSVTPKSSPPRTNARWRWSSRVCAISGIDLAHSGDGQRSLSLKLQCRPLTRPSAHPLPFGRGEGWGEGCAAFPEMNSAGCRSCVRQFADQPAVFAARRLFHVVHFAESDLEIIAQLAPNAFLDSRETRGMKLRPGDVTEFSDPRLFLAELHGV